MFVLIRVYEKYFIRFLTITRSLVHNPGQKSYVVINSFLVNVGLNIHDYGDYTDGVNNCLPRAIMGEQYNVRIHTRESVISYAKRYVHEFGIKGFGPSNQWSLYESGNKTDSRANGRLLQVEEWSTSSDMGGKLGINLAKRTRRPLYDNVLGF